MASTNRTYDVRSITDLRDMIRQSAEIYGDLDAFLVKNPVTGTIDPISFRRYQQDINSLGTSLHKLDLAGKMIAIISENRYEWCVSYLGIVNGTGVAVPLDKELPDHEIELLLRRSDAAAVICSSHFVEVIAARQKDLPKLQHIISMDHQISENGILSFHQLVSEGRLALEKGDRRFLDTPINHKEMSLLIFTSGTTDQSKGVMLSHQNISYDMMAVAHLIYADNNDLILSILPLHHTYECTAGFLTMVYLGVTICFCEGLRHITKNLNEYKPTMMMSVPLILENVYNKVLKKAEKDKKMASLHFGLAIAGFAKKIGVDIRRELFKQVHESLGGNLRLIISGAAALNPKISKSLRAMGFNIMQGYGLTECSPIVSVNQLDFYRDASAGQAVKGIEVAVDKADEDGIGEIIIKGPIVMLGYYKNEEATNMVLKDNWLHTGDNGWIDKDGFIYISGRQKNVIVTKNGKNIFPEDVELYLNKSEYIRESLVYGVDSDDNADTVVCAKIVPNMEVLVEKYGQVPHPDELYKLIKQEVMKANKKLSGYKKIKHFEIREGEFEKTTTKKIKRHVELVSLKTLSEMVKVFKKK